MKSIETEITINAPANLIWAVLTDFDRHGEWNPFIRSFGGEIREGRRFSVTLQQPDSKPMTFHPRCMSLKANREFRWLGHLFFRGLFDGEHIFELEELGDDRTRFIHRENFRGLLVPLMWKSLDTKTRQGFVRMNEALKQRAEAVAS